MGEILFQTNKRDCVLMADLNFEGKCQKGLLPTLKEVMPHAHHQNCVRHIWKNFTNRYKDKQVYNLMSCYLLYEDNYDMTIIAKVLSIFKRQFHLVLEPSNLSLGHINHPPFSRALHHRFHHLQQLEGSQLKQW
ncbi:hypothetical protein Ahy_B07g087109 [Arachis hypogaea]|uniref:MULE transposase domain-containing protein n=1 Tax=Arachis hypogaea TaxID=3818 RepID=A0A444YB86_ARAHY|nr:hypothetical protein Ahy_B07g087109 [Arachis hypogaea]